MFKRILIFTMCLVTFLSFPPPNIKVLVDPQSFAICCLVGVLLTLLLTRTGPILRFKFLSEKFFF
jgi:ABC-type tungstate transport system substrate-binding protein